MFQGCSHVIFLHQLIRDLKVCSHLLPRSALASALLAFDGRFCVIISQGNFPCRIIVPLNHTVCEESGRGHVVSHDCFCLRAQGHAQLPFVSFCVNAGGLNFDPAYV